METSEPADSAESIEEAPQVSFPCENCGAQATWDPEADALVCSHCEHRQAVPRAEGTILERPLSEAGISARGLGVAARVVQCGNCGARVVLEEAATARSCAYCGSANVLAQEANRNLLRPESLVPLDVGRGHVEQQFRAWLKRLWFRPGELRKTKEFQAQGLYVPFWTFDCAVHSDWSADAGHYYYVTENHWITINGRRRLQTRRVRKVRWVPAWGSRDDHYDDLLVNASRGLPDALLAKLGGFDLQALAPYRPEYLAGWSAEEYQVDLEQGWQRAQEQVEAGQRARCAGDVPGDTQRNLRVRNSIHDVRWKHVLLPLWSLSYRFRGRAYVVLIHGQSGRVAGQAPLSWPKILGFAAALLLVLLVILLATGAISLAAVL